MSFNPYAPPVAVVADVGRDSRIAPPLWTPNAAINWSIVFSPIFGSILQMKNWRALGEDGLARSSRNWAVGTALFTVAAVFLPATNGLVFLNLIVWYFVNARQQVKYVKLHFGESFPRKSWTMPMLAGVGTLALLFVLGFLAAFAIELTHRL